jgi:PAS domain S-box-containing protein
MDRALLKVLVVDDDEDDFIITKEIFEEIRARNIIVDWAPTYQKGLESYFKAAHDIYIVDYLLGAKTGIDFLMEGRDAKVKNPVIMITGKGDHQVDKLAMAKGAADYLVKGELDAEKLERTVRYALDRFQARKQLADSEAKYRNVFEKLKDMIFIADPSGMFLDSNNSCLKILGYTREELLSMKVQDLMERNEDKENFVKQLSLLTEIIDEECILLSKSGQKKICLISTIVQEDSEGKVTVQGVIHDITKRRKIENDLATAEKLAVTGRVVRMIGHEIRNPLTNINLSLEQIESEIKDQEEIMLFTDIIRRNSERINTLITELLNSSKPAQLKMDRLPINGIVQDAIELIRDRIMLKRVKLDAKFAEDICDVTIDKEKVKIAILNILVNAVEAVDDDTGVIQVRTRGETDVCVVEICDNGCGIPSDMIDRIFDPFFSGKLKGTGLGLSSTHNIIRSHNGTIDVSSMPGKGTCFTLKFNFN